MCLPNIALLEMTVDVCGLFTLKLRSCFSATLVNLGRRFLLIHSCFFGFMVIISSTIGGNRPKCILATS